MSPSPVFEAWAFPPGLPAPERTEDLPPGPGGGALRHAAPSGSELARLTDRLVAGGNALRDVPAATIAKTLGAVGARFGRRGDPLRAEALRLLPAFAGVSAEQARHVLDGMARDWTVERLSRLLDLEFTDPGVLDGFRERGDREAPRLRALGPRLGVHVCAGTVPGVAVTSLIRGLLVKGPVLLKPGAGDAVLPTLFARGLPEEGEIGRALAAAAAVLYWPGGTRGVEDPVLAAADLAVVYGSDATVRELRSRLRPATRLVAHPHRMGVAVIGPAAYEGTAAGGAAASLARAVSSFDQRGCVSPHQAFLLGADLPTARGFARRLGAALDREALALPPGPLDPFEAAAVQQLRAAAEMRAAGGEEVELLRGADLGWTLLVEPPATFRPSCLSRTVHVTPVPDAAALLAVLEPVREHLQSVGIAGLTQQEPAFVERLTEAGATRCVPLDDLAFPPAWWMHDGEGPLRSLVRWAEWTPASGR